MLKFSCCLLCFIFITNYAFSITGSVIKGNVGDYIGTTISIDKSYFSENQKFTFEGRFEISNPLVFYPDSFFVTTNKSFTNNHIEKIDDSTFSFQFVADSLIVNEIKLFGELLAGNDSIAFLNFYNMKINNIQVESFVVEIKSNNIGSIFPYLRIAQIEQNAPNPVIAGNITKWKYVIDKQTDVKYYLMNLNYQMNLIETKKNVSAGIHTYELFVSKDISAGVYYFYIETDFSNIGKLFVIIK